MNSCFHYFIILDFIIHLCVLSANVHVISQQCSILIVEKVLVNERNSSSGCKVYNGIISILAYMGI